MKEKVGDIFESGANVIVIPIHNSLEDDYHMVMGRGVMFQAKKRYPDLPDLLGRARRSSYNFCLCVKTEGQLIAGVMTKNSWCDKDRSDIGMIIRSARELVELIDSTFPVDKSVTVALPRIGCGGGRLDWDLLVKPMIFDILDDRFTVYRRLIKGRGL